MSIQTIKQRVLEATKAKRAVERDVLRLVLGEVQTLESRNNKPLTDEQVDNLVRKVIQSNTETLGIFKGDPDDRYNKLVEENRILNELLPTTLTQPEIEAFFLNGDGPEFEQIRDAKSDGQAMGMAMKLLKASGQAVLGDDVKAVVAKIRSS